MGRYLKLEEAASYLGIPSNELVTATRDGKLASVRLMGESVYEQSALDRYQESRVTDADGKRRVTEGGR